MTYLNLRALDQWHDHGILFLLAVPTFSPIPRYLVSGILFGPRLLASLSAPESQVIALIEQMSIALIAVAAGAELQVAELRRTRRQVLALTGCLLLLTWALVFPLTLLLSPYVFPGATLSRGQLIALASMAAVLMGSRSPAAALAVLRETNAKGPFASLTLAVIVVKDITVVVLFAFNLEYLRAVTPVTLGEGLTKPGHALWLPIWHVALGAGIGYAAAYALETILMGGPGPGASGKGNGGPNAPPLVKEIAAGVSWARSQARGRNLHPSGDEGSVPGFPIPTHLAAPGPAASPLLAAAAGPSTSAQMSSEFLEGIRLGLVPLLCLVLWRFCAWVNGESLVACVVVGLVVSNRSERARAELEHVLGQVLPMVFVAFFGVMGAHQSLASLLGIMWAAGLIFAVRLAAIWIGTLLGYGVGQAPPEQKRYAWMAYVTQAGLEMGLASTVGKEFGGWGQQFATMMVATILLNLVSGSPFYKRALALAGESQLVGKRMTPTVSEQRLDTMDRRAPQPHGMGLREGGPAGITLTGPAGLGGDDDNL